MRTKINNCLILMAAISLSGCSMTGMALNDKNIQNELSQTAVALLKLNVVNNYHESFTPKVSGVGIYSSYNEKHVFRDFSDTDTKLGENGTTYLMSFKLKPGEYTLKKIEGTAAVFPIFGNFNFLPDHKFTLKDNEIYYLGEITAVNVERTNDNDRRAGPLFPLIDQAASGFSGGTFKITVEDHYESNIKEFKRKYPFLADREVKPAAN